MTVRSLVFALCLIAVAAPIPAAEVAGTDAVAIRAVISDQLDAFTRDDAQRAFSFATPSIRAQFGNAEQFMAMVRASYPVVYRRKSFEFGKPEIVDGEFIQPVKMMDGDGRAWLALYPMQRQTDGNWRINGCQVARAAGIEARVPHIRRAGLKTAGLL